MVYLSALLLITQNPVASAATKRKSNVVAEKNELQRRMTKNLDGSVSWIVEESSRDNEFRTIQEAMDATLTSSNGELKKKPTRIFTGKSMRKNLPPTDVEEMK